MKTTKPKLNSGLTMIELLVYLAIFSIVLSITIQIMSGSFGIFAKTRSVRGLTTSGSSIIERMSYNIRKSTGLGMTGNTFGVTPGSLSVQLEDSGGVVRTYYYTVDAATSRITETIDSGSPQFLHGPGQTVTNFTVSQITAGDSLGININLTLTDNRLSPAQSETFTTTTLMRGTY